MAHLQRQDQRTLHSVASSQVRLTQLQKLNLITQVHKPLHKKQIMLRLIQNNFREVPHVTVLLVVSITLDHQNLPYRALLLHKI